VIRIKKAPVLSTGESRNQSTRSNQTKVEISGLIVAQFPNLRELEPLLLAGPKYEKQDKDLTCTKYRMGVRKKCH